MQPNQVPGAWQAATPMAPGLQAPGMQAYPSTVQQPGMQQMVMVMGPYGQPMLVPVRHVGGGVGQGCDMPLV